MIKKIFLKQLLITVFFSTTILAAQHFETMPIQSGFNSDVIANGIGPSATSTTANVDGTYYNLVANDFKLVPSSNNLTYGLPANGIINSAISTGLKFQMGDLNGNNSLRLDSGVSGNIGNSGTLVFSNPIAAFKIYMLATSGQGTAYVSLTVNFTDNTTQVFTQEIPFWNSTKPNYAIAGIGRINRNTDQLDYFPQDPKLYQTVHNIDVANQTKLIQSITIKKVSTEGLANIFAFSADAYSDCIEPVVQPASAVASNSAQISWTVPTGTQAVSHDIYYSTDPTPPNTSTPNYTGVTGTSYTLSNLLSSTKYYYWVRTNCNGTFSQSAWSLPNTFTTLCGVNQAPYLNNFNNMGNLMFPGTCWKNNLSGGTPATGPTGTDFGWGQYDFLNLANTTNKGARVVMYDTNKIAWLTSPLFDLSTGGYTVSFNYGVTAYAGNSPAQIGVDDVVCFMISNDSGNTWTILKTWDINNSPSNTSNQYIYNLTGNLSTTTRFAFYSNTGTVRDFYDYCFHIDDFAIESNAQLNISEVEDKIKELVVYPNPFKDILYLSGSKDLKKLTIGDASGRIIKIIEGNTKQINLSTLNRGLYLITLYFKDGSQSIVKAIKE